MFYQLRLWKAGNEDAFFRIYKRFHKPILRQVLRRVGDQEVAEELTQEIFLKAHRYRHSYQEKFAFSTWLWTIARNTVFDHLRKVRIANQHEGLPGAVLVPDELPCLLESAEAAMISRDEKKRSLALMEAMMKSLTLQQKRVLWLRIIEQISYLEISRKLGLSLSAVKNLAYRARLTLAQAEL